MFSFQHSMRMAIVFLRKGKVNFLKSIGIKLLWLAQATKRTYLLLEVQTHVDYWKEG